MASRRESLGDGAPPLPWQAGCLMCVGAVLLVATVLYGVTAGDSTVTGSNATLTVLAALLSALLLVCACFAGCRVWLEQPKDEVSALDPPVRGPLSVARLACFACAALLAAVAFILGLVALGSLGTSGYGELVAGVIISAVVVLFFVAVLLYFCAENAGVVRA